MLQTPVLFIIFNRPETTKRVFSAIRNARPTQLFIAADGPRPGKEEQQMCNETRKIVSLVDWECSVHTLFRDHNLGCGKSLSEAITWFFRHVEQGIILEDDCLPEPEFFPFCSQLLDKYQYVDKIMEVSGLNMLGKTRTEASYLFSTYDGTWGWATWRRAWEKYDYTMSRWQNVTDKRKVSLFFGDANLKNYWMSIFDKTFHKQIDTWDYQWLFARIVNDGIGIIPKMNMISNIGFGSNATHTFNKNDFGSSLKTYKMNFPLIHPQTIAVSQSFDKKFGATVFYKTPSIYRRIVQKIKDVFN